MTEHTQLQELIDDINKKDKKVLTFVYGDGHQAALSSTTNTITITSDNPKLVQTLAKLMERVLSGNVKGIIDKNKD